MRVDSLGPKTWLLAAVAGWALCLWVLALFGMGSRLGDVPADTSPQRLPGTTLPTGERLGPISQYAEIGVRPLFSENRRPQTFTINPEGDQAQANTFDYILTSVLMTPAVKLAILKPAGDTAKPVRVKLGEALETAPQWTLASLQPRSAIFRGPEGEKTLELRVFDGIGGLLPPRPGMPPPPAAGPIPAPPVVQPGQQGPIPQPPQNAVNNPSGSQPDVVQPTNADGEGTSTQAQLEAIRKRIEARRAQLRQQSATPPGKNP